MTKKEQLHFLLLRSLGNFLVLISLYGVLATFGPAFLQEARYRIEQAKGIKYVVKAEEEVKLEESAGVRKTKQNAFDPVKDGFAAIVGDVKDRILIPSDANFSILIPKIGASAKVIPNVDPENEKELREKLQEGVAHARGTVFPGLPGNTYLFAHSTDNWWDVGRYNAVFYLLKDVTVGDEVIIFFENRRYNYSVSETFIADPSEVSLLVNSRGAEEKLVLQTCWPPGTTWKRLFVVALPKAEKNNNEQ